MSKQLCKARVFSSAGVELASSAIPWPGQPGAVLEPDATKAYCEFDICFAWPVRTAYGTSFHPGTLANSFQTMLHQVFNRAHEMRAYADERSQDRVRDRIFGAIVGVEYPETPKGGWKIGSGGPARIHAAAVLHKNADGVLEVLAEHLSGRHRWAVSQEVLFVMEESGFVLEGDLRGAEREVAERETPPEFREVGLWYVPVVLSDGQPCPESLRQCFSETRRRVVSDWGGARVTLLKGGVNGRVHFQGVGMVRYGAEREAQIQKVLASDPDALPWFELEDRLKKVASESQKIIDILRDGVFTARRRSET